MDRQQSARWGRAAHKDRSRARKVGQARTRRADDSNRDSNSSGQRLPTATTAHNTRVISANSAYHPKLRVWEGMGHAFESVSGFQEGERNMREVFGFLEEHL